MEHVPPSSVDLTLDLAAFHYLEPPSFQGTTALPSRDTDIYIYIDFTNTYSTPKKIPPWFSASYYGPSPLYFKTKYSGPLAVKTTAGDVTVSFLWWEKTGGVFVRHRYEFLDLRKI